LFGYIFSLVRNLADAEDLFQETCVALWEQFDRFQPGTNFAAWSTTVARFRVLKFFERQPRPQVAFSEEAHARLMEIAGSTSPQVEDARREALASCVEKLPERQRSLLWQVYGGKSQVAEVARTLQRTTHSVYSSLRHIRSILLRCVEETLGEEGA
jgi:RNA polymerase sigma-70 factor (ECF subfamily)